MKHTVCVDGKYIQASEAEFKKFLPGKIAGRGVFETFAVYGGKIFACEPHMARFYSGLKIMRINFSRSEKYLYGHMIEVLKRNRLKDARLRLMVVSTPKRVSFNIVAGKSTKPSSDKYLKGYRLATATVKRNKGRYTHVKSIDYARFHAAHYEAVNNGYDDALLLNKAGNCVETPYANIFIVKNGSIITPPVQSGCLNGVTRNIVMIMAAEAGIPVKIKNIKPAELAGAEECFMTGSLIEVMPVTEFDGKPVGGGRPGRVTRILAESYAQLVEAFRRKSS